ncbi:MAG TPA: mandelate racemase/muconate lactonizing enzyme family protein [Casimicrobiaceae bacterium]|nr:mandelate racemase/muconate lactonizing enzyme family protein [Casimicrobiaceae bacterium]
MTAVDIAALSARVSDQTVWTFVRLETADGRVGWGEATLHNCAAAVHAHVRRLAPAIVGRKSSFPTDVVDVVGISGRDAAEAAAISAIDQALWDVTAQARGEALANALGDPLRTTIDLYANINRGTLDRSAAGFAARAIEAVASGFDAIKIAPFDGVQPDDVDKTDAINKLGLGLRRIAAVRAAIGPDVRLLVDCHWRLTEILAHDVLREVESLQLYWLECPLPEDIGHFPALRRLRSRANAMGVRLAGCEMMIGRRGFRPFLDAGVYDVIMPDVKYAGGVRELVRIAQAAAVQGVACSPHNPSGPIAHAHSLHVSAHVPLLPFLEIQYGESPLFFDFVDGALPHPRCGRSDLPRGNGLGVGLARAALRERLIDIEDAATLREVAR